MTAVRPSLPTPASPWVSRALAAIVFVVSFAFSYGEGGLRMSVAPALLISAIAAGAVWLTESRPRWALAVVAILTVVLPIIQSTFSALDLVIVFVIFRVTVLTTIPVWMLGVVALVLLTATDAWQRVLTGTTFAEPSILYPAILAALAVGLGAQSRTVVAQHARLRELQAVEQQQAVDNERLRIARDLHDVAAHHLTALVVRNRLARRLDTPEALSAAADFTAETASDALRGLKQVVHLLRTEDGDDAPLSPAPGAQELASVIDRMEAAGLVVHHDAEDLSELPDALHETIVRIAQESFANVLKHRGPGECWLEIERTDAAVIVRIDDRGITTGDVRVIPDATTSGRGITGMVERVIAHGGTLTVGRSQRGGFQVTATLPLGAP